MEKPIIEVKGLGKKYNIAHMRGGYVALRDVIAAISRKPFAFLMRRIRLVAGMEKREEFWALKDVNFTVKRGEVVGVIGANGAGKSTLLKILSQITPPTEGEVILRGRVGSLLEVGTGFHPELTGRENIFLNGAILGMKRTEIARKFDEIVAFAGVDKFLDTPVKHYSSGMYVRLAFSVAAHMEPDILIIDEVLAVGDAEFQKKCLGKMDEISKKDGRTVLFVSHNLSAIKDLCPTAIMLDKGCIAAHGPTQEVIQKYNNRTSGLASKTDLREEKNRSGTGVVRLVGFHIENKDHQHVQTASTGDEITLVANYEASDQASLGNVETGLSIAHNGQLLTIVYGTHHDISKKGQFRLTIKDVPFTPGTYSIGARVLVNGIESDWPKNEVGWLEITSAEPTPGMKFNPDSSIALKGSWSNVEIS